MADPMSFYEAHKGIILFLGAAFFALMGAAAARIFTRLHRKNSHGNDVLNRLLLEQANAIVWTVDRDMRFTSSRGAGLAKLGLTQDQVVGQSVTQFFESDPNYSHQIAIDRIAQALSGKSAQYEEQYRGMYWESHLDPLRDKHGNIVGCVAVSQDVTERKLAEERLRASELKFKNIINASPMGIHRYELTADDRLIFIGANPASDRLLGVSHEQFLGKTIEEAFPALTATEVPARYREAARNGKVWQTEQIDYNEGRIRGAFEVVAFQTEPGKMAALFNDITARKQAEMALRQSEEWLKTLIEQAPDAFFVHDHNGRIMQVNEAACQFLGYRRDELIGMSVLDVEQNVATEQAVELWKKIIGGQVLSVEGSFKRKNGTVFPAEVRISAIQMGSQTLLFGFARDISERKEMEKEKEKLHTQMVQIQKMEAIGTLAGGIAHDFNNLMMGIQGRASLMAADLERTHTSFEHIQAIMEYTRSAADLTKQLLGVASGGKYEVKPIDLNQVAFASIKMFGRTQKGIRIHTKLHEPAPVVLADRGQIEQVLLNMYVNAWQAMPNGGDIFLETTVVLLEEAFCATHGCQPGRHALISVTDTGIGMDSATLQRIFDPFFTTKEKGRGTGLGLASAYGIIKNHAGVITVYSEVGQGTTFNIYLPLSDQKVAREISLEEQLVKGTETILLVDDETMITQVGAAMLGRLGYRPVAVNSGEEALTALRQNTTPIHMVILDMIMPGMDGNEAFDQIRALRPNIPVMLSSGYALNNKANEIMRKGCNGFIQKPFSLPELSHKIRSILDQRKAS